MCCVCWVSHDMHVQLLGIWYVHAHIHIHTRDWRVNDLLVLLFCGCTLSSVAFVAQRKASFFSAGWSCYGSYWGDGITNRNAFWARRHFSDVVKIIRHSLFTRRRSRSPSANNYPWHLSIFLGLPCAYIFVFQRMLLHTVLQCRYDEKNQFYCFNQSYT